MQKTLFIRNKGDLNNFILFKITKGGESLKPFYVCPILRSLEKLTLEHVFLKKNGIKIYRKILNLDISTAKAYDLIEI